MTPRRRALLVALFLALLAPLVATSATASPARHHHGKDVVYTAPTTGVGQVKPRRIFFTADAGPYVRHLRYAHWGREHAIARGTYVSTCGSLCGGRRVVEPATLRFKHLVHCPKTDTYAYRRVLMFRKPHDGQQNPVKIATGCPSRR